jgi:hypothetical protein
MGISWRAQVRLLTFDDHRQIDKFVSDKWTKPTDEKKLIDDPALLPSVL